MGMVRRQDFEKALKDITPSSQRSSLVYARALPKLLRPLLNSQLSSIRSDIGLMFSNKKAEVTTVASTAMTSAETTEDIDITEDNTRSLDDNHNHNNQKVTGQPMQHYRYLIHGPGVQFGQSHLGTAVLHLMEEYPMYSLDLASLYGDSTAKCADEAILRIFKEAQRNT